MFGTILTAAYTLMLAFVLWRARRVPVLSRLLSARALWVTGAGLWLLFVLGRFVGHDGTGWGAFVLEAVGMRLLGCVFLLFWPLLIFELLTGFGRLGSRWTPRLRGVVLGLGLAMSVLAMMQAVRAPAVVRHEVIVAGLPPALDGTLLVAISDAHLGSQLGAGWFASRVEEIQALGPDAVIFLGDIFEGHGVPPAVDGLLSGLSARLGKFYVDGNHDSPGRHGPGLAGRMAAAGFHRLADGWVEVAPGLVLAGVRDSTRRRRQGREGDPLAGALTDRPPGATVLLSHTPWEYETAASRGVGLMLSGHTHGGQLWPFGALVEQRYPLLAGRYEVGPMSAIVTRGLGTWGPRMRLWHRGEILAVTLRAPSR